MQRLKRGDLLLGTIITLPSTEIAEIFLQAGFDWLFLDLEHSTLSIKDAQSIMQTVSPKVPCLVRVAANNEARIKKALDIGASGIIVPQVKTAIDAEQAVKLCKYPPEGVRSIGIARAQGYGDSFKTYVESANKEIAVILQIEHIDAVGEIENILNISGVDCLFVGPYDLSGSMGKMGLVDDDDVQNAISRVRKYAEQTGVPLGIFGTTPQAVKPYVEEGYNLITVGIDTMLISKAAKEITGFYER